MSGVRFGHSTQRVILMNIVLIGGTVEALVLAWELGADHNITVIEIEAEMGLPMTHPGRIMNSSILDDLFSEEQIAFLAVIFVRLSRLLEKVDLERAKNLLDTLLVVGLPIRRLALHPRFLLGLHPCLLFDLVEVLLPLGFPLEELVHRLLLV